jgi:hypothetical protein
MPSRAAPGRRVLFQKHRTYQAKTPIMPEAAVRRWPSVTGFQGAGVVAMGDVQVCFVGGVSPGALPVRPSRQRTPIAMTTWGGLPKDSQARCLAAWGTWFRFRQR